MIKRATLLVVHTKCPNKHIHKWQSQPTINGSGAGNMLLSAAILFSGNTYVRISEMFSMLKVQMFSEPMYYKIQKAVLFPKLNTVYKRYRNDIYQKCAIRKDNNLIGDGRCDSPGYSAKYGTYTLMSTDVNKIIDFHVVHVVTAGNSCRMEKKGLQVLLDKMSSREVTVSTLTTDRHVQIRSFMKKVHPEICHQFDVWHFGKSIKKSLTKAAKRKECADLGLWIKAIVNHLWWCCASCEGNEHILREKWLSMLYHVQGIHTWQGNDFFHECEHGALENQRKWLKLNSPSYQAIKTVLENKSTLADMKYLTNFCHTGNLEVFHSLLTKYCPKRLHFSMHGMVARTQLAVLAFNSSMQCEQAVKQDGTPRYKQCFSRITQTWVVKKIAGTKERPYLEELMTVVLEEMDETGDKLPEVGNIAQRIAPTKKPDKNEAIRSMRTRFQR